MLKEAKYHKIPKRKVLCSLYSVRFSLKCSLYSSCLVYFQALLLCDNIISKLGWRWCVLRYRAQNAPNYSLYSRTSLVRPVRKYVVVLIDVRTCASYCIALG